LDDVLDQLLLVHWNAMHDRGPYADHTWIYLAIVQSSLLHLMVWKRILPAGGNCRASCPTLRLLYNILGGWDFSIG
jgi:hypothetical protein